MTRSRRWLALSAVFLTCALAPTGGQQAGPLAFRTVDLEVGGRVTEVIPLDLDGNGRKDLFVVRGREALIYLQELDGSWPRRPNQRFRFHPRTILFDLADLDGDGTKEVVLLYADEVRAYFMKQRRGGRMLYGLRPRKVVACPGFLSRPVEDEVRRKSLARDLNGDDLVELILPRRDGFSVLENQGRGAFADAQLLPAPPEAALHPGRPRLSSQLFASYWFANPVQAQFDADGPEEIVVAQLGQLQVFGVQDGQTLPLTRVASYTIPDQRQFSFNVENPFELDFTMPLRLVDLDQDGRVDVCSTHVGQGTTRVFRNGTDPATSLNTPELTVRAKGVTLISFFVDLDGDGREDLILPRVDKIGVWSLVKAFITRSIAVEVLFFHQRSEGELFSSEPDVVRELEIPITVDAQGEGVRFGTTIVASLGDFDGDGRADLLYRTDSDELSIYRGLAGHDFDASVSATATVPDVEPYQFCLAPVDDLDGDGKDDVILRYVSWDRDADRITLLIAQ